MKEQQFKLLPILGCSLLVLKDILNVVVAVIKLRFLNEKTGIFRLVTQKI